ncbi:ABC transporter permease [Paenibacillus koleovorans]|uniref:ABC transporter permease n=1 Tax=Paenibacillus koleovorans TaxID=121608 RepID=UPI000FD76D50|nr:ABC transporter permease subunit [Paenibacillus koleovorans]
MNKSLWVGVGLTLLVVIVALFGPLFTPYTPKDQVKVSYQGTELLAPPVKPGAEHWFGTDKWGYDIFTQLMYGAKYTLGAVVGVAAARTLLGGGIGLLLGFTRNQARSKWNFNFASGVPMFIIVFFFMYGFSVNSSLSPVQLTVILCAVFVVLGTPSVVSVVQNKTWEIRKREYIEAAISVGAGRGRILLRHIVPHLKESLLMLFVNELILALTMFGQLGIFNLFVGGTTKTLDPVLYAPRVGEWAGLVANARNYVDYNQWMLLFPMSAYMTVLLGFFLLSKGLESKYRNQYSKAPHL